MRGRNALKKFEVGNVNLSRLRRWKNCKRIPFRQGVVKLQGRENIYRARVGDYRIPYEVLSNEGLVLIEKIDFRSTVYGP